MELAGISRNVQKGTQFQFEPVETTMELEQQRIAIHIPATKISKKKNETFFERITGKLKQLLQRRNKEIKINVFELASSRRIGVVVAQ